VTNLQGEDNGGESSEVLPRPLIERETLPTIGGGSAD